MKKKKTMIALALLIGVFVLGVGYATVTGVDLSISGEGHAADYNLDVAFTGTPTVSDSTNVTATSVEHGTTATINVQGLRTVGETKTATYTIKNFEDSLSASVVQSNIVVSNSTYFEVSTDMTTAQTLAAQGTTTVTVTVKLKKVPITDENSSTNITVTIAATPVEA